MKNKEKTVGFQEYLKEKFKKELEVKKRQNSFSVMMTNATNKR